MSNELATLEAPAASSVNHPLHYNSHASGVEAIDVIEFLTGNLFNAVKYVWRANHKGKRVEDMEKALWYAKRELDRVVTSLPEVPAFAYELTDRYVAAEGLSDPMRALTVYSAVYAHTSLTSYKENVRHVVELLEQMVSRENAAALATDEDHC